MCTLLFVCIYERKVYLGYCTFFSRANRKIKLTDWNPEYPKLASEQMRLVTNLIEKKGCLDTFHGESSYHIGSTSILGMMGKPSVDFAVITKDMLPDFDDDLLHDLGELGYEYCGPAPHMMDKNKDHWFFNHHDPELGYTMHLVSKDGAIGLEKLILFRDYCNSNEDARARYTNAKRAA